jgi:hypothetical protein
MLMRWKRKASNRFFDAHVLLGFIGTRECAGNEQVQTDIFDERATLSLLLRTKVVVK